MADLTTLQKAPILDALDQPISVQSYSGVSSDPLIASIGDIGSFRMGVIGNAPGTVDITVTRNVDGATAGFTVTVEGAAGFTVHLGAPEPK